MRKKVKISNVFRINYDREFFYMNFAKVDEFRDNLTDNDVDDLKTIKLEAKYLSSFISGLIKSIKNYEEENNIKILK